MQKTYPTHSCAHNERGCKTENASLARFSGGAHGSEWLWRSLYGLGLGDRFHPVFPAIVLLVLVP